MKKKNLQTTLIHTGDNAMAKNAEEAMTDAGITMGTLRFSIGLEHPEDIIEELDEALLRI